MDHDNTLKSLLFPGETNKFFDIESLPPMEIEAKGFSKVNAWWLAEVSRLIYKQESDEIGNKATSTTRNEILNRLNLNERKFYNKSGTQCAIIESNDKKFAILVFRGSHELKDWLANANVPPTKISNGCRIHSGFKRALDLVWKKVRTELDKMDCPVFYTGHSLGAALATIAAYRKSPHSLYTFGSPLVGNGKFKKSFKGKKAYRIVNNRDIVATVPRMFKYQHTGQCHYISNDNSILINPRNKIIKFDKKIIDESLSDTTNESQPFKDLPEFLGDHSPINYVAHMQRQLSNT
ncbi:MAG: lipase family protein [Leptospirales bacterium]